MISEKKLDFFFEERNLERKYFLKDKKFGEFLEMIFRNTVNCKEVNKIGKHFLRLCCKLNTFLLCLIFNGKIQIKLDITYLKGCRIIKYIA